MTLRRHHRFTHRLRVRWAEVDAQRIVFNGHYLMYFDTAMGEYWRALGLPYESAMARLGGDLYVRKTTLDYHASARYDELLDIHVRCEHIGNTSMRMHCEAYRADTLLVSGRYDELPAILLARYEGLADGVQLPQIADTGDDGALRECIRALQVG